MIRAHQLTQPAKTSAHCTPEDRQEERDKLSADVEAFMAKGGKIYEALPGESAQKFKGGVTSRMLNAEQMREIIRRVDSGETVASIAYRLGVFPTLLGKAIKEAKARGRL